MKKTIIILLFLLSSIATLSTTHKVRPGDTLEIIGRKYNITVNQLMVRNDLTTESIRVGDILDVGGDNYHIVTYGESLGKIAARYKVTPTYLMRINGLSSSKIFPGQKLKIKDIISQNKITPIKKYHNYFSIKEFVDRKTYYKYKEKSIWFIDKNLIIQMNQLRELFGRKITINNWAYGGRFQWRGFRTQNSPEYTPYSSHSFGRACDFDVEGLTAEQARRMIIEWYKEGILISKSINLEKEVNWVHLDIRNGEGLRTFNP